MARPRVVPTTRTAHLAAAMTGLNASADALRAVDLRERGITAGMKRTVQEARDLVRRAQELTADVLRSDVPAPREDRK